MSSPYASTFCVLCTSLLSMSRRASDLTSENISSKAAPPNMQYLIKLAQQTRVSISLHTDKSLQRSVHLKRH
jgi:hypothetical protein